MVLSRRVMLLATAARGRMMFVFRNAQLPPYRLQCRPVVGVMGTRRRFRKRLNYQRLRRPARATPADFANQPVAQPRAAAPAPSGMREKQHANSPMMSRDAVRRGQTVSGPFNPASPSNRACSVGAQRGRSCRASSAAANREEGDQIPLSML